jgi:hypothetical protein
MLIAAKSMKEITTLKAQLISEFEMKDLGPAKKILGIEIKRDRKSSLLFLSQEKYIEKVLHRFNMLLTSSYQLCNVLLPKMILSTYHEFLILVLLVP